MSTVNLYIDGNNLYRAATELGYKIDYKRFRSWLRQKYKILGIYWGDIGILGIRPDIVPDIVILGCDIGDT